MLTMAVEIYTKMLNRKATDSQDAGAITNMMSVDSSQVGDTCSYIHDIFPDAVVQLVLSAVLLFSVLGWSAVASFAMLAVMFPLNTYFARLFARAYKGVMDAMDERSEITNEVLQNAKLVKVGTSLLRCVGLAHLTGCSTSHGSKSLPRA